MRGMLMRFPCVSGVKERRIFVALLFAFLMGRLVFQLWVSRDLFITIMVFSAGMNGGYLDILLATGTFAVNGHMSRTLTGAVGVVRVILQSSFSFILEEIMAWQGAILLGQLFAFSLKFTTVRPGHVFISFI